MRSWILEPAEQLKDCGDARLGRCGDGADSRDKILVAMRLLTPRCIRATE